MNKITDHNLENTIVGTWLAYVTGVAVEIMPLLQSISFIAATILSVLGIISWVKKNIKKKND